MTGVRLVSIPQNLALATLALGGATIGTDALGVTGTATISGVTSVGALAVTASTTSGTGFNLASANTVGFVSGGSVKMVFDPSAIISSTTGGPRVTLSAASSTAPTLIPNNSSTNTGFGAQASGNISAIVGGAETTRWAAGGFTIISGKVLTLGNAATTGLTPGVLAATTNATIVISDSGGQAYRIPCII